MANETMVLLEKIVVPAAGASSIEFTSIPQSYTDLQIRSTIRSTRNGGFDTITIKFNGNLTNMSYLTLEGRGNSAVSFSGSSASYLGSSNGSTSTASTFSNLDVYIPNYTSSANKSYSVDSVAENNATGAFSAYQNLVAGLWSNTAAITSITISPDNGSFVQHSTFYLYGIAKEGVTPSPSSAPYATGGDSIVFDGTYWIHTFRSSGTFTPKKALTCDYLVVAGGAGGGGFYTGAGGGAGGLRSTVTATGGGGSLESAVSLTNGTAYTITVGAGGAGGGNDFQGDNGSNSSISGTGLTTITSTGGGGGGSAGGGTSARYVGKNGGSGGGSYNGATVGTGTANQGYAGGLGNGIYAGGGGGGAGAVGGAGSNGSTSTSSTTGGNGGAGVAVAITGTSVTYAGGGGGSAQASGGTQGQGGSGGGANGAYNAKNNATANTGGGGGGSSINPGGDLTSGNGGSGIVIVRYAA